MLIHRSILKLIAAASKDKSRCQLNGVHIAKRNGRIHACATSGKILATVSHVEPEDELPGKAGDLDADRDFIVTRRLVDKIARAVKAAGAPLRPIFEYFRIGLRDQDVEAEVVDNDLESTRLSGRKVEGTFPDYTSVLPTGAGLKVRLNSAYVLEAARLLQDLVKDFPDHAPVVTLHVSEDVDKFGNVCKPLQFDYRSQDGVEVKILVMPCVQA